MERMPSIQLALQNEKTEMEFYLNEAKRSNNPLAKGLFFQLAKEEEEHMQRIQGLYKKLISDGSWPENMPLQVQSTNVKQTLRQLVNNAGSEKNHDDNDEKALEKAIVFETKGSKFYSELANLCENNTEKSFFLFLAEIEREHQLSLTDSLAYLKDPKTWMLQHERAGLDGA